MLTSTFVELFTWTTQDLHQRSSEKHSQADSALSIIFLMGTLETPLLFFSSTHLKQALTHSTTHMHFCYKHKLQTIPVYSCPLNYRNPANIAATAASSKFVICDYSSCSFSNFRKYLGANHAWIAPLFQVPDTTFVLLKGKFKSLKLHTLHVIYSLSVRMFTRTHIHTHSLTHSHTLFENDI